MGITTSAFSSTPIVDTSSTTSKTHISPLYGEKEGGEEEDAMIQTIQKPPKKLTLPNKRPTKVYVAFFKYNEKYENDASCFTSCIIKRMKVISPIYEHCQLVFEWPAAERTSTSITQNEPRRATFSTTKRSPSAFISPRYRDEKWVVLDMVSLNEQTPECEKIRARIFRWSRQTKDTPFNARGYYLNFVPPASICTCLAYDANGSAYFCAEQVATAMKMARIREFCDIKPYRCTPDDVHLLLTRANCTETIINLPQTICYEEISPESMKTDETTTTTTTTPPVINDMGKKSHRRMCASHANQSDGEDEIVQNEEVYSGEAESSMIQPLVDPCTSITCTMCCYGCTCISANSEAFRLASQTSCDDKHIKKSVHRQRIRAKHR
jgi:hypothetical protein